MTIELADQPVFKLGIDAGSCRFEVRLNDVPILASDMALPYDVEFPVSEWIVHGPNRLAAVIEPPPGTGPPRSGSSGSFANTDGV